MKCRPISFRLLSEICLLAVESETLSRLQPGRLRYTFMKDQLPAEFRRLLESDSVTDQTRDALLERLNATEQPPRFFEPPVYEILKALCGALAPGESVPSWFTAGAIDRRLAENSGNGWRYDKLPPDGQAYRTGLRWIDETVRLKYQSNFAALGLDQRRELLGQIKASVGKPEIKTEKHQQSVKSEITPETCELPPPDFLDLFLKELCAEFAEIYYSHPLALAEIGYIGFADQRNNYELGEDVEGRKSKVEGRVTEFQNLIPAIAEIQSPELKNQASPQKIQNPKSKIQNQYDVVVIGTGAGGSPILARLAQAGFKVVALEAGKSFDYREFATDERAQNKLFWTDERLSAGEQAVGFGSNNSGCGVGGSTLHFTAYTPRPQPDDFRVFSDFGVGRDWPLAYEELEPYFEELEWFLGISGTSPYPWGKARRKGYPLPPLPLNGAAQLMEKGCAQLGIKTAPAPNAALSNDYFREEIGWRPACTNRGFCQAGCSVGAKGSMDVTFLPLAVRYGAEIRPESFVTEFEFDRQKNIKSVVYSRNGEIEKIDCRHVFLCAGAIETPRLLLNNNLANSSGQVGRNFMAHTGGQLWGTFDENIFPHRGIPGGLISEDLHRPPTKYKADFAGGYLLQSIGVMPVTYASQLARGEKAFGSELGGWMSEYNRTAGINILGDCLPYENNYLELSDEKDARGLPKPRVHFSHGDNETRMTVHAEKIMREIWTAAGARRTWIFQRNAHIIGTCVMGRDGAEAVVDEFGRSFDVPNLSICDNSIFPSALAVNPALTIMALALRAADKFLE